MHLHPYFFTGEIMTQNEITKIAKEVGFSDEEIDKCQLMFERFASLVASQVREEDRNYESTARQFFTNKQTD